MAEPRVEGAEYEGIASGDDVEMTSHVPDNEQGRAEQSSILIVDDDPRMRESVRDLLGMYGYHCVTAEDGPSALDVLSKGDISLALLDIQMPGMSGVELLQRLKEEYPHVGVIMVSGESTFENAADALRGGAADFIRKPYQVDDLVHSIQRTLHKLRLERAVEQMHRQLGLSEQRHRFIVDNSPDIIYMLDEDGYFSFVNEPVASLLGYTPRGNGGPPLLGVHPSR